MAALLRMRGADVSVCHSQTPDRERRAMSRAADLVIVAVGKPGLVGAELVKPGAVVVDIGINKLPAAPGANGSLFTKNVAVGRNPGCSRATRSMTPTAVSGRGLPLASNDRCVGDPSSKVSTTGCLPAGISIQPRTYSDAVIGT